MANPKVTGGGGKQHNITEPIEKLPVLPSTVVEIVSLDPDDEEYPTKVQEVVERDPSLAARVMIWANSAESGARAPVQTLPQAIMRMGAKRAAQMITSVSVMRVFVPSTPQMRNLWKHALQTATGARELARVAGGVDAHQAYLVGLLHDIGRFVMFSTLPEALRRGERAAWGTDPLLDEEASVMGCDHSWIGWYACTSWGFPEELAAMVQVHHAEQPTPQQLHPQLLPLLRVVQQADHLSNLLLERPDLPDLDPAARLGLVRDACSSPAWTSPPLSAEQIEPLVGGIVTASKAATQMLGLE